MQDLTKGAIAYLTVFGVFLGVLYNLAYWGSLGVDYFAYVSFQDIAVSSIPPIFFSAVLFFLVFIVLGLLSHFVSSFFKSQNKEIPSSEFVKVLWVFEIGLILLGVVHLILNLYLGEAIAAYAGAFFSLLVFLASLCFRFLSSKGFLNKFKSNTAFSLLIVVFLSLGMISYYGFSVAHAVKSGEFVRFFQGKEFYGRYAGKVGDYHVFWRKKGEIFFLPESEAGSFVLNSRKERSSLF